VRDPIELRFILGAPQDPSLAPAYKNALALFRQADLTTEVVEEQDIGALVARIEQEVRAHEATSTDAARDSNKHGF
jgi:hypothetical protein